MFNGILDKVKSKITRKPLTQVQLERIGVDVKVRNSGIKNWWYNKSRRWDR